MLRRSAIAFIWFWGLWAAGSTLDFLRVMPTWPLFVAGVAVAAYALMTGSANVRQTAATAQPHTSQPSA
jgi:hypothetical protein